MHICIITTEKNRTARSDKNTNSCPKTLRRLQQPTVNNSQLFTCFLSNIHRVGQKSETIVWVRHSGVRHSGDPPFRESAIPGIRHSGGMPFRGSSIPRVRHSGDPPFRRSAIPGVRHSGDPPFRGSAIPRVRHSGVRHFGGPPFRGSAIPGY